MRNWQRALMMPFAGGKNAMAYTNKVIALSPIAYWPLAESSGTTALDASGNGRNGTYSNVTLGATGIGDGRTAATFVPASSSYADIYSASLAGAFSASAGTVMAWAQVSAAGVWTDANTRIIALFAADGNNQVRLNRNSTNNVLTAYYRAGGTTSFVDYTVPSPPITWFHWAITWNKPGDVVQIYYNGSQVGGDKNGLGVWAGSLASTGVALSTASTSAPSGFWSGNLAHAAVWATPLSAAQILTLATV